MMTSITERAIGVLSMMTAVVLLYILFPAGLPRGLPDDLSSDLYPKTIAVVLLALSAIHLIVALAFPNGEVRHRKPQDRNVKIPIFALGLLFCTTFVFLQIGFFAASFSVITCYGLLLGERKRWILPLAVVAPVVIYLALELLFEVRLPTFLDHLT